MVTADYKCLDCKTEAEHEQDGPLIFRFCVKCDGHRDLERLWKPVGIGYVTGAGSTPARHGKPKQ